MYSKKINQLATNLNPQSSDLIPIGDAITGQLKTTTFGTIFGTQGDSIESGGIVTWSGTGLIFNISPCIYYINGIRYATSAATKTLAAADATFDRIDVFAVDINSQVVVIQGIPSSNPQEPQVDNGTQLGLTNVTVTAGSSTPTQVVRTPIYDENLYNTSEWFNDTNFVSSAGGPGGLTSTTNYAGYVAYTGSLSDRLAKVGLTTPGSYIKHRWTKLTPTNYATAQFQTLSFAVRLDNPFVVSTDYIRVYFLNSSNVQISNTILLTSAYSFNPTLVNQWQLITIPIFDFQITTVQFTKIEFKWAQISIGTTGIGFDRIELQSGINNTVPETKSFGFVQTSNGIATATVPTDTLTLVSSGLTTLSATGKTVTIATPTPIPSQTGNTGKFLTTNGSVVSWAFPTDTGITSLNGLGATIQTFATGTSGTDFGISSVGSTHTFNLPTSSATNRGALSSADWSTFNGKQGAITLTTTGTSGAATFTSGTLNIPQYSGGASIGGTITGGTTGSILFINPTGILAQDNANLFWDDTNNRLGIGNNTPKSYSSLTVTGQIVADSNICLNFGQSLRMNMYYNSSPSEDRAMASGYSADFILDAAAGNWKIRTTTNSALANATITTMTDRITISAAGIATFYDNVVVSKNQNAATTLTISNTTSGTGSQTSISLTSDASAGNMAFGKYSTTTTAYKIIASKDSYINNFTAGDIAILNDFASGSIKLAAGASSTAQLTILNNGNITQTVNQNAATIRIISNTTSGTGSQALLQLTSDASSGSGQVGKFSTTTTPYKILASKDTYIYNGTIAGDIAILNDFATGQIKLAAGASSTAQLVLKSTGQLQLNNYTSTSAFTGTAVGYLGFDASGNILSSVAPSGGGSTIVLNRQAASYTLVLADAGKLVEMNVAGANNLTIPLNSSVAFPTGTTIDVSQYGAGQTTFVATAGVTIRSTNGWLKMNAQYGAATLVKIGTDEWYLFGNINA